MIRYYLTPYKSGYVTSRPTANTSKIQLYQEDTDKYVLVKANPWKDWCIVWFDALAESHTNAQADSEIKLIPFINTGGDYLTLDDMVGDITLAYRTNISDWLEAKKIPTDWITGDTKIREVLRYVIKALLVVQMLKDNYPEVDLGTTIAGISQTKRNMIETWMESRGNKPDSGTDRVIYWEVKPSVLWDIDIDYFVGDIIKIQYQNRLYFGKCIANHISDMTDQPGRGEFWRNYWSQISWWREHQLYSVGNLLSIVEYTNGVLNVSASSVYQCTKKHISKESSKVIDTSDFTSSTTIRQVLKRIVSQYGWSNLPVIGGDII